ncbi:RNA binding protein EIF1AD [Echinococcus multilocularis]|uniref:Probable RNA-binding protein EIF1AD n=1 Tax=Echinococcus multilocularis TaxID=6211 RepID=A0A068Y6R7_ECHMU|nr:RNA binding protein EIF1AD [Echinococcus multilocularis]
MHLSSFAKRKRALVALHRKEPMLKAEEFLCMSQGNCLFSAITGKGENIFVSIPERFRNAYYFSTNAYVICSPLEMPKVKGEVVCLLSDDQVLALANSSDWPEVFTHLPEGRTGKNTKNEAYLDADALPPSDAEAGEDEERYEGESSSSEESNDDCRK